MKKKRALAKLVICFLLTTLIPPLSASAANFSDTGGHWAESYINKAVSYGFVNGYPDGTFLPDNSVTRAEFATMVNKAFRNSATAGINFTDVPYNEWYYNEISKAVAAAYVAGYENNTFSPGSPITRQEAAVVISRLVPAYGSAGNLRSYGDESSVADWAYTAFQKVNGKGYIGAYDDGYLHPLDKLTRAQTAKIICDILDKENVVTSDPVVKSNGTKLSGKIYSNSVTIHKDLDDGSATIDNCVILGNLAIQGGGDSTVTVSNSRVAQASVERASYPVRLLVKGESVISTVTAAKTAIIQTSNLAGGLFGGGILHLNTLASSDITLLGNFPEVNVNGSNSDLRLESGTVSTLNVASGGRASDITIDSGANVTTANVNAESYFHGTGTINRMNVNADDVTYETKPRTVNVGSQYDNPDQTDADPVTFSPKSGDTKVNVDTKITITFATAMKLYDGTTISDSDLDDFLSLRESSASGSHVDFSATINSTKKVITITPDDYLDDSTKYYVILDKNSMKDTSGDGNKAYSVYFTTGTGTGEDISFSPRNSATGISVSTNPKITFSEAIERYNGSSITTAYLEDNIVFCEGTRSTGAKVDFSASIDTKKKVITITPDSNLKSNQSYYIGFGTRVFREQSGSENIAAANATWTTATTTATVTFSPRSGTTGVAKDVRPTISFSESIERYNGSSIDSSYLASYLVLREGNATGAVVSFTASIDSARRVITVVPAANALSEGKTYYLGFAGNVFRTSSGKTTISANNATFSVGAPAPTLTTSAQTTDTSVKITAAPSAAGTIYAVLQKSGDTAPSVDQVIAGKTGNNQTATWASSQTASSASDTKVFSFTSLEKGTGYTCYLVIVSGNVKSAVKTQSATTSKTYAVLSGLDLSAGSLNTSFSSGTTKYTVTIPATASDTTITARAASDVTIEMSANGTSYSSSSSATVSGGEKIYFRASKSGLESQVYEINIVKAGNTALSSLTVGGSAITPAGSNYTASVAPGDFEVSIAAADSNATITCNITAGNGTLTPASGSNGTLTTSVSGTTSWPVTIRITVRSNNDTGTYTLEVEPSL